MAGQQDETRTGGGAKNSKKQCHGDCLELSFRQPRKVSSFYSQKCSVSAAE